MKYLWIYLAIGALVYGGWWVYKQGYQPKASPTMTYFGSPSPAASVAPVVTDAAGVKVFNVSGANFRFDPKTITVSKGDQVRIVFKSEDMMHDFNVDELGVDGEVIPAGETVEIEFTAPQTRGKFEYYCSVGNHRANGMVGTLIVE